MIDGDGRKIKSADSLAQALRYQGCSRGEAIDSYQFTQGVEQVK